MFKNSKIQKFKFKNSKIKKFKSKNLKIKKFKSKNLKIKKFKDLKIQKFKNLNLRIQKFKFKNPKIQKFKFKNLNSKIQKLKFKSSKIKFKMFKFKNSKTKNQKSKVKRPKIFKKYKKKLNFNFVKKKLNLIVKNKSVFYNLNNKYNLLNKTGYNYNLYFSVIEKKFEISDSFYKIKANAKRLLLNVFFKNKSIKNNRSSKIANYKIFLKFIIFFFKKIIIENDYNKVSYVFIKIKKKQLRKRLKRKKVFRKKFQLIRWYPFIKRNIFFKLFWFIKIFNNFFNRKHLKIVPLYNKSHSKNTLKLKKKRRK